MQKQIFTSRQFACLLFHGTLQPIGQLLEGWESARCQLGEDQLVIAVDLKCSRLRQSIENHVPNKPHHDTRYEPLIGYILCIPWGRGDAAELESFVAKDDESYQHDLCVPEGFGQKRLEWRRRVSGGLHFQLRVASLHEISYLLEGSAVASAGAHLHVHYPTIFLLSISRRHGHGQQAQQQSLHCFNFNYQVHPVLSRH